MNWQTFLIRASLISIASIILLIGFNIWIDLYGLFWRNKDVSIYADERTSKYLLAHRYVPENFDGYILGPSLSANLNPKDFMSFKIYNLSMMGANITEQKAVVDKAIDVKPPKYVIICLHPYLTADHGMKTDMINEKEYNGAFGSVKLYKAYAIEFMRYVNLMPNKYPKNQFNDFGYNDYDNLQQTMPVEEKIKEQLQRDDAINAKIDSIALCEFNALIDELTLKNVKIIAYFHPIPSLIYEKFKEPLEDYETKMRESFNSSSIILNFNGPEYKFFTTDLTNYIDHGHLSKKGQYFLLDEILKHSEISQKMHSE